MTSTKKILMLVATLLLATMASSSSSHAVAPQRPLPNPVLYLAGAR